ncbi:MAG: hypothetical protein LBO20_04690, partial [Bifidobacteriaceae bacterium]|nr:hypothetical protein [Bifidobacteriaceae bacterium]
MKAARALGVGAVIAAGAAATAIGAKLHRHWGASAEEAAGPLPGDNLVGQNITFRSTRAITIEAPPEAVWPWLVQMGLGRGGWYSYDKLLGLISPMPTTSASEIKAEFQDLKVADPVELILSMAFTVAELVPNEALVLFAEHRMPVQPWTKSWAFVLKPLPGGATRLLVRETSHWDSRRVGVATAVTG